MVAKTGTLLLELAGPPGADDDEVLNLVSRLSDELQEFGLHAVPAAKSEHAPSDSKGSGAVASGELIVALIGSGGVSGAIVQAINLWLQRQPARSVKLTLDGDALEITGASSEVQDQLVANWLRRHAGGTS